MEKTNFINIIKKAIEEKNNFELRNIILNNLNNKIKDILNEPINNGNTLLHYLVEDGSFLRIIKILFDKYKDIIDINKQNDFGNTLLYIAVGCGNKEIVKFLINQKNIDLNLYNTNDYNAFRCAIKNFKENKDCPNITLLLLKGNYDFSLILNEEYEYFLNPSRYCKIAEAAIEENCVDVLIKKLTILCRNNYDVLLELLDKPIKDGKKLIHLIAEAGQLDSMKSLIDIYKNINTKGDCGFTPLQLAVNSGNVEIVKYLLEQENIDIYVKDKNGFKLPVYVKYQDVKPEIEEIITNYDENNQNKNTYENIDITDTEKQYYSDPLKYCAIAEEIIINNNINVLKKLFEAYKNDDGKLIELLDEMVTDNKKLIQLAAEYGRLDVLKILINKYSYINIKGKCNFTALDLAIINGHTEVVEFLLNQKNISIETPNDNSSVFHFAAEYGRVDILNILIKKYGTDNLNSINYSGKTPLHLAVENGQIEVVKLLFKQKNIDIKIKDYNDFDILYYALKNGDENLIKIVLTESIKKLNKKNNINERKLIHYIVKNGNIDVLKLLLSMSSIDIDIVDNIGRTPLDIAMKNNNIEAVDLLLRRSNGLEFFKKKENFDSIFTTIKNKTPNILKFLTNYKSNEKYDINKKIGNNEITPLHYAVVNKNYEAVKILLENGADINLKTAMSNSTPINFAIINKDNKMIELLLSSLKKQIKNQVKNFNDLEKKLEKQQKRIKNLLNKINNTKWKWLREKREIELVEECKILSSFEKEEKIQAEKIKNRIVLNNFSNKDITYLKDNRILTLFLKDLYKIGKEIDNKNLQSDKVIF